MLKSVAIARNVDIEMNLTPKEKIGQKEMKRKNSRYKVIEKIVRVSDGNPPSQFTFNNFPNCNWWRAIESCGKYHFYISFRVFFFSFSFALFIICYVRLQAFCEKMEKPCGIFNMQFDANEPRHPWISLHAMRCHAMCLHSGFSFWYSIERRH